MDKNEINVLKSKFDKIAHYDENIRIEFWYARELQSALGYIRWENFDTAIKRAKTSCENAGITVTDHFRDVTKMVDIGSNTTCKISEVLDFLQQFTTF